MRRVTFEKATVIPKKIVCVGKNYRAHIEEMGSVPSDQMTVFMKPNVCITDELVAHRGEQIHFESEICLLIHDGAAAGVGVGLDLTKRATQKRLKDAGLPWERAKAFEGSALFSHFVDAPPSLSDLELELYVNSELRQRGGPKQMLYEPSVILQELRSFIPLEDGDIVMTGTPSGVGPVEKDALFEARLLFGKAELISESWRAV
ncbi:MAG TPA: 2-keto-4-pentenoate hydratase [Halieaceae bacterium]|nr:2-keto-4-pentenoate hydratase [Halieaceae bacterium]